MNRLKIAGLLVLTFLSIQATSQIKLEFEKALKRDTEKEEFISQIHVLNRVLEHGVNSTLIDSLKSTGNFSYLQTNGQEGEKLVVVLDIISSWAEAYMKEEREGRIDVLKSLRASKRLKLTARLIANEVPLPKKTDQNQSYNDFYLEYIKALMLKHKVLMEHDKLNFAVFQAMERERNFQSESSIQKFRESFIHFLYDHYKIS